MDLQKGGLSVCVFHCFCAIEVVMIGRCELYHCHFFFLTDRFGGPIYSKRRRIMGHNAPCDDVTMIVCSTIVYNRGAMLQAP